MANSKEVYERDIMAVKTKILEKILNDLSGIEGIEENAIVSRDGLLMASTTIEGPSAETFAAMSASMLGAAETAIAELGKGIPSRVIIESKQCKLVVTGAGPKALVIVMAKPTIGLGLILLELENAVEKLKKILQ